MLQTRNLEQVFLISLETLFDRTNIRLLTADLLMFGQGCGPKIRGTARFVIHPTPTQTLLTFSLGGYKSHSLADRE